MTRNGCVLWPNLGAEEGSDWRAIRREPATQSAALLWSLLYSGKTQIRMPANDPSTDAGGWIEESVADHWPPSLGATPEAPVFEWIEPAGFAIPWYASDAVVEEICASDSHAYAGSPPAVVAAVHDKAFAVRCARELDLLPRSIEPSIVVLDAEDLVDGRALVERLSTELARWPEWMDQRFTLKPRRGSSGRGRVAGVAQVDSPALIGALPRLAARGGAVFEPWLERGSDLSVCFYLPPTIGDAAPPTLLGSLEMIATPSGGYRGHCGEIDNRGRVFSGHPEDESMRADAAALSDCASRAGYSGVCGIDAFTFREGDEQSGRWRMRPAVEFNARPTMGLVALGLLRRARQTFRETLAIEPGSRCAFLIGLLGENAEDDARQIADTSGARLAPVCLASPRRSTNAPIPYLFFAPDVAVLRRAYRAVIGC